jgi:hypothetical protein
MREPLSSSTPGHDSRLIPSAHVSKSPAGTELLETLWTGEEEEAEELTLTLLEIVCEAV